jgi:hypothetical protein
VSARVLARLLSCTLLAACSTDIEPVQPLINQCTQPFECGTQDVCDPELKMCVRKQADEPYAVAFQVVPSDDADTLIDRMTLETQELTGELMLGQVRVPKAVVVDGRVLSEGKSREAELAFVPRNARPYLSVSVSASTLRLGDGVGFRARLEPNTQYDVQVYPLGTDSVLLPPHTFAIATGPGDSQIDLTYGGELRAAFRGKLVDAAGAAQPGRKLRLREKRSGTTVSSLGTVAADGSFSLVTKASVLGNLASHELMIGLEQTRTPWLTHLTVDGARLRPDTNVIIPVVPAPVRFIGSVEAGNGNREVGAEVTFLSRFPPPSEQARVNGRDWCRASLDGGVACAADLTASVVGRELMVDLLPGDYDVFVRPSSERSPSQPAATTAGGSVGIETQPDAGAQSGWRFALDTAKIYSGVVTSPSDRAMPFVTVTAQALGLPGNPGEVGTVGRYNRTAEALSDRSGAFRMAVDLGYYDFLATPPAGSGFAWISWPNRLIGDVAVETATLKVDAPVIARGTLLTSEGRPVAQARIDAFAVVRDLRTDGERAVRIAQAVSDDAGVFVLHLPPRVGKPEPDAGMDAGVGLDAGVGP